MGSYVWSGHFLWLLLLLIPFSVAAQQPIFYHINLEQGLAHKEVNALYQDRFGFIWIGTEDGLQQYDGYRFTTFRHELHKPLTSLSSDDIAHSISEDSKGRIWIVTEHQAISRFDPNTGEFEVFNTNRDSTLPQAFNRTHNAAHDRWGNVYTSTFDGAYKIDTADRIVPISHHPDGSLKIPIDVTNGIYIDSSNHLWLVHSKGISRYDIQTDTWQSTNNNKDGLAILDIPCGPSALLTAADGSIWMTCYNPVPSNLGQPLYQYVPEENKLNTYNIFLPKQNAFDDLILTMLDDGPGVWLGTANNGLLYFDKITNETTQYLTKPDAPFPLSSSKIKALMKDRDGNIWIGTDNGINILPASHHRVHLYNSLQTNGGRTISAKSRGQILPAPNGSYYVSIQSFGLYSAPKSWPDDGVLTKILLPSSLETEWIDYVHLIGTSEDYLFIQIWFGDPWIYNTKEKSWVKMAIPGMTRGKTIFNILVDSTSNTIWFGSKGSLFEWDPMSNKVVRSYLLKRDDKAVNVVAMAKMGDSILWLATGNHGLLKFSMDTGLLDSPSELPTEKTGYGIFHLGWTGQELLIGTEFNGFFVYNDYNKEVHHFTRTNGLKSNRIRGILNIADRSWLIVTEQGWAKYTEDIKTLSSVENQLNIPRGLILKAVSGLDGTFLFIYSDWILKAHLNPENTSDNGSNNIIPRLTSLRLYDRTIPAGRLSNGHIPHFDLPWSENILSASFSTLDFVNADFVEFAYQLKDYGSRWESLGNQNTVVLSDLPSGNHELRIRARYPNDSWSDPVTVLSFHLAAPFWRQAWFYLVIAIVLGAIGFWWYRQRITRRLAVEQIRNQVSRDLHDDLGSGLSSVAIMSNLASRNAKTGVIETQPLLTQIEENVQEMQERLQEIVWALHPRNDTLGQLVARLRSFAHPILEIRDIGFTINLPHELEQTKLSLIQRKNLFLALKEAINNAAKYSEAELVELVFERKGKRLLISVQDDGIGFDINQVRRGNGLDNITSRAVDAGGVAQWTTVPGRGCTVLIQLPITS